MKLNKLVRSILKTAVYIMDQTAERVDRASDRAAEMAEDARNAVYPRADHTLRNLVAFAAGIGVGVGAGMLLAPSSGTELRNSISDKVHDISNRMKGRGETSATGSDVR
jgi:predicted sugar kinase